MPRASRFRSRSARIKAPRRASCTGGRGCGRCGMNDPAKVMRDLAEDERRAGHGDRAIAAYKEAVKLLRESNAKPLRIAHTIRHLGDVYVEQHQLGAADTCYREALQIYRADADPPVLDLANAIRAFAVLKERVGEREEAAALWEEAGTLYERAN